MAGAKALAAELPDCRRVPDAVVLRPRRDPRCRPLAEGLDRAGAVVPHDEVSLKV